MHSKSSVVKLNAQKQPKKPCLTNNLEQISNLLVSQRFFQWESNWFNHKCVDDRLIETIKNYQTEKNLEPTGEIDFLTYKLIYNERFHKQIKNKDLELIPTSYLIVNQKNVNFYSEVFYNFVDNDSLLLDANQYFINETKTTRQIDQIIVSPDYCLSFETSQILNKQAQASTHFYIDFDGSIYQFIDIQNISFEYEKRNFVDKSVYIEVNNPVLSSYENFNNLKRNISANNTLDYLPEQIKSLDFLINSLNKLFPHSKKLYHRVGVS